jgi:hypothetical protein
MDSLHFISNGEDPNPIVLSSHKYFSLTSLLDCYILTSEGLN